MREKWLKENEDLIKSLKENIDTKELNRRKIFNKTSQKNNILDLEANRYLRTGYNTVNSGTYKAY